MSNAERVLMSKLDELKGLLAHSNFDGRMDILIEKLADNMLQKLKPRSSPAPGKSGTRYIPVAVKRAGGTDGTP
jgi:hypothetical protein